MRTQACTNLSMPTYGILYRIGLKQESVKLFNDYSVRAPNELCWDKYTFYYVDSCYRDVEVYNYNTNRRYLYVSIERCSLRPSFPLRKSHIGGIRWRGFGRFVRDFGV